MPWWRPDRPDSAATTYIDALTAIKAFENAVCHICGEVYDKYKPHLVRKIGLEDAHWRNHENIDLAHRVAELGVCQDSPSGRETLYVYLRWDGSKDGVPDISAAISVEFSKKGNRNEYAKLSASPTH
jgi:hypothetical protein